MSGAIMTRTEAEERVVVSRAQQEQESAKRREATANRDEEHRRKLGELILLSLLRADGRAVELHDKQEEEKLSVQLTAMQIAEAGRRRHISLQMKEQIRADREEQRGWFWEQEHLRVQIVEKHRKVQIAMKVGTRYAC
eukprot:485427-Hanusia_phi.AAC.3